MLLTNTGTESKYRKINHIQGVKRIIPKVFQSVPQSTYISWKFYENLPIHFTVMLLTGTLRRLDERPWNSLGRCETVQIIVLYVVHDILWKCHENSFTHFYITLLRNTDPGNRKINPGFKGLIATFQKCCWQSQISLKTQKKKPSTQGVKRDTLNPSFPDCSLYQARPILKISWKSFHAFFRNVVHRHTNKQTDEMAIWRLRTCQNFLATFVIGNVVIFFKHGYAYSRGVIMILFFARYWPWKLAPGATVA